MAIFWPKMAKNPDILAKKQNLRFKRDRGLFICFLGREIHWYMLKFVIIIRNYGFGHFFAKMARNPDILTKIVLSSIYIIDI